MAIAWGPSTAAEPHPVLEALVAGARFGRTPCGDGEMVWRAWGAGEPLVLLHGGSGSWRHWARNVGPLSERRMVLVPDLPGLGQSAMPPAPLGPDSVARVLMAGLDAALPAGARYDLVGFSFGALCSGHLAAMDGARCRSLTIVGAGALGFKRSPTELLRVREKDGAERMAAHRHNLAVLMFADAGRIDDLAMAIQEWNTQHARLKSRGFAESDSLRGALERGRTPLNAIYGERDAIAYPHVEQRLELVRTLRARAQTAMIPDAGHWVAYEAAEEFNAALARILARGAW